jgi:hypothetical protein
MQHMDRKIKDIRTPGGIKAGRSIPSMEGRGVHIKQGKKSKTCCGAVVESMTGGRWLQLFLRRSAELEIPCLKEEKSNVVIPFSQAPQSPEMGRA